MRACCAYPSGLFVVDGGDAIARLRDATPTCVAAAGDTVLCGTSDAGLYRSTDRGRSFARVDALADEHVTAATESAGTWWVGTEPSAVYRSDDGGRTWRETTPVTSLESSDDWAFPPRPHTHHVRWIQARPDDPETLAVAVEAGALVRTRDGGETWTDRVPDGPIDTHTMAVRDDAPARLCCAAGDGYYETPDWGDTWTVREDGLDRTYCWSVALPAPETRVLSAATGPRAAHDRGGAAVYRRVGDDPWARVTAFDPDGLLAPVLAAAGETVFALSNRGLSRSDDAGETWTRVALADAPDERPAGLALL